MSAPISGSESHLDEIIGLAREKSILKKYLKTGRTPHALLFTGADGIGKSVLAEHFIMEKFRLESGGTLSTSDLHLLRNRNHPDIMTVVRDKETVKLEQISGVRDFLSMKPSLMNSKAVLIKDAHRLTREAGNSFLKMLEEPPGDAVIILCSDSKDDIQDTVLSRCAILHFGFLTENETISILKKNYPEMDEKHISELAKIGQGTVYEFAAENAEQLERFRAICRECFTLKRELLSAELFKSNNAIFKHGALDHIFRSIALIIQRKIAKIVSSENYSANLAYNKYVISVLLQMQEAVIEYQKAVKLNASGSLALTGLILEIQKKIHLLS